MPPPFPGQRRDPSGGDERRRVLHTGRDPKGLRQVERMASDDDVAAASGEHGSTVWHALVCQARDGLSAMTKLSAESLARAGATMPDVCHTGESMIGAPQPAHARGRPPGATPPELETAPPTDPTHSPGTDSGCVPQVPPTRIIRKEKTHSRQRPRIPPSRERARVRTRHSSAGCRARQHRESNRG